MHSGSLWLCNLSLHDCVIVLLKEERDSHWQAYAREQRARNRAETRKLGPAVNIYKLQACYKAFLGSICGPSDCAIFPKFSSNRLYKFCKL